MSNTAIIVGDRGQDGTLLRYSLEKQGIKVVGIGRNHLSGASFYEDKSLANCSIFNMEQVTSVIKVVQPREVYYLAAHHVSSEQVDAGFSPIEYDYCHQTHVVGLLNFLWAIRSHSPLTRLFYAASSLVFSGVDGPFQNEETKFTPCGFYGLTKAQGVSICKEFRQNHGIFAASGILYNHESVLRSDRFLSKKLIIAAHKISLGIQEKLTLGNSMSETDWGYAPDYVDAFQRILRIDTPDDFVIATGESHSVAEFAEIVFSCFGLDSKNYLVDNQNVLTRQISRKVGDSSKLRVLTSWAPTLNFKEMVTKLVSDYMNDYQSKIN